jgi:hypothetical protein
MIRGWLTGVWWGRIRIFVHGLIFFLGVFFFFGTGLFGVEK